MSEPNPTKPYSPTDGEAVAAGCVPPVLRRDSSTELNGCDHEFADTKHCVKCGWVPVREPSRQVTVLQGE